MEEWHVLGFQKNATFKGQDGETVRGTRLFLAAPADPATGAVGEVVNVQFTTAKTEYDPVVGDQIRMYFNRYGKIQQIEVV